MSVTFLENSLTVCIERAKNSYMICSLCLLGVFLRQVFVWSCACPKLIVNPVGLKLMGNLSLLLCPSVQPWSTMLGLQFCILRQSQPVWWSPYRATSILQGKSGLQESGCCKWIHTVKGVSLLVSLLTPASEETGGETEERVSLLSPVMIANYWILKQKAQVIFILDDSEDLV